MFLSAWQMLWPTFPGKPWHISTPHNPPLATWILDSLLSSFTSPMFLSLFSVKVKHCVSFCQFLWLRKINPQQLGFLNFLFVRFLKFCVWLGWVGFTVKFKEKSWTQVEAVIDMVFLLNSLQPATPLISGIMWTSQDSPFPVDTGQIM